MILVDLSRRSEVTDIKGVEVVILRGEEEDGRKSGTPRDGVGFHLFVSKKRKWMGEERERRGKQGEKEGVEEVKKKK